MNDPAAVIQGIYAAFGKGDVPAILDALADDVRWDEWADNRAVKAGVPWLRTRRGKAGVAEFFGTLSQALQISEFQVLSLMSSANQVVAEVVMDAKSADGRPVRDEELHLWTLNEQGKVTRFRHYVDTAKHIEAAGLG